jgi:valyl-tRNA synthetase
MDPGFRRDDGNKKTAFFAPFVAKAPPEVLEESRERKAELEARRAKVEEALKRLG